LLAFLFLFAGNFPGPLMDVDEREATSVSAPWKWMWINQSAKAGRSHMQTNQQGRCELAAACTVPSAMPPALAAMAAGRDHILTFEFAHLTHRAGQTIRKNYSQSGKCFGIRPLKIGNRLMWPVSEVADLLNGGRTQ
jgi:hypothetical protein